MRVTVPARYLPFTERPREAAFRFPGGLADYLSETLGAAATYAERPFAGKVEFRERFGVPGSVESTFQIDYDDEVEFAAKRWLVNFARFTPYVFRFSVGVLW